MSAVHTSRGSVQDRRGTDEPLKSEGANMLCFTLMRRTAIFVATAIVLGAASPAAVVADSQDVKKSGHAPADEQSAIQEGKELQGSRRWVEAIEFYEKTLKTWPESEKLRQGLRESKVHFSIERRYSDKSFIESMLPLSRPEARASRRGRCRTARHRA